MIKEKLDLYYRQFEIFCRDYSCIIDATNKSKVTVNDLYPHAYRLIQINYSEFSPLQVIRFFKRDQELRIEQNTYFYAFASNLRDCLYSNRLSSLFQEEFSKEYETKEGISRLAFSMSDIVESGSEDAFKEKQIELNGLKTIEPLKSLIDDEIKRGFYFIDMFLIHPVESRLKFDTSEFEPSERQLEYINKWIDGSVTITDIRMYTMVNYVDYIYRADLSSDTIDAFEDKQRELFNQEIEHRLRLVYSDIEELGEPKRTLTVNAHLEMLAEFTRGNVNELLIKRINDFIVIDNVEEVLLEYDRLLRYDFDDTYKLTIYDFKNYRKYSPTFTANLIYRYQKKIGAFGIKKKSKGRVRQRSTSKTFGFKGDVSALKSVIDQLQLRIDLLHPDCSSEDLVTLLTSKDYTSEKLHIVLGCETVQFSYILKTLKKHFIDLTAVGIERSKCVYSRNNELITGNNLHGKHPNGVKKQEEIDKIINQLR
jgi:hypothetical protein